MIKRIRAFLLGVRERHLSVTTHHPTSRERAAYDRGRTFGQQHLS